MEPVKGGFEDIHRCCHSSLNVLLRLMSVIYTNFTFPNPEIQNSLKPCVHVTEWKLDRAVLTQIDEACGYGDLEMLTIKA